MFKYSISTFLILNFFTVVVKKVKIDLHIILNGSWNGIFYLVPIFQFKPLSKKSVIHTDPHLS